MRAFLLFAVTFVFLTGSASSYAQSQILPNRFGSWQSGSHPPIVMWPRSDAAARYDSHPEYAQTLTESGAIRIEERYYEKGSSELAVRLFKLRDPSCAYEVYTSQLRSGMRPAHLGQVSTVDAEGFLVLLGNLVIEPTKDASQEELAVLVRTLEPQADKTPIPPIPSYLPVEGLVVPTERYALGPAAFRAAADSLKRADFASLADLAGFASGAEAMFARYKNGAQEAVLLLIDYPTPQLAELHLHHLQAALAANPKLASTSVERKGSLLSIVLGPTSEAYAARLRNAVNYETQVTWNEASQTATDPPITSTLVKIIMGTGVLMVMAVVFGVAFGGVRVITKRLFPGKVFDRPERMEVLQLGLSSKPIDPRDLY
jgi:hypothetical protein